MTHYTALVIGPEPEKQIDVFEERDEDDWEWMTFDYYSLGGRYTGFFPLRADVPYDPDRVGYPEDRHRLYDDGHVADRVRLCEVDFARARAVAENYAKRGFAQWQRAVAGHGRPVSYEALGKEIAASGAPIKDTSDAYAAQPAVAAYIAETGMGTPLPYMCLVREFGFDEAAYIEKCRHRALTPHVLVHDGLWAAQDGEVVDAATRIMTVGSRFDDSAWSARINELLESLPPDTRLTLFDCHC